MGEGKRSEAKLNFGERLRIALGSAKGILYLHTEANPPIFHRDVKSTNILLDSNLTAKVADFGLSRLAPVLDDEGTVPDHVSTVVKGTPGYLDPEYFLTHKLTDKSDVYSLGVVFLELLTGMQPIIEGRNIVREVNMAYHSGTTFLIIDKRMGSYPSDCLMRFVALALRCCHLDPEKRPSMLDVVRELENLLLVVPDSVSVSAAPSVASGSFSALSSLGNDALKYTHASSSILSESELTTGYISAVAPR
ncbi:putative LRR receptor-like serine/threonine-protein kinase [Drosera capensis]